MIGTKEVALQDLSSILELEGKTRVRNKVGIYMHYTPKD